MGRQRAGTVRPVKSGEDLFLRADTVLDEEESLTYQIDCNTVGPVPTASGYGYGTLTHSAAHVLDNSKEIHTQKVDDNFRESSENKVGVPETTYFTGSRPTRGSDANLCGTQILHFTISTMKLR